jgi:N-acetylmuramoyl-L-alanine amidase
MSAPQKIFIRLNRLASIVAGLLICITAPYAIAKQTLFETHMPVVAIDPGHGGKDTGAQGPNGTLEKSITLNLARMIAQQLAADYRVVLTRNDDYGLDNSSRTAAANHAKADVFISLHTGSSFNHQMNRSSVYFYWPFQGTALRTESNMPQSPADSEFADRWDMIQVKYRAASEKLAIQMQSGLTEIWQPQDVAVQGIPLSVLKGADMPAVAIEIGNLANANAAKELTDNRFLTRIAKVIVAAITAFLSVKPE